MTDEIRRDAILNRMHYIRMAIANWQANIYNKSPEWAEKQVNYFENELKKSLKELKSLTRKRKDKTK